MDARPLLAHRRSSERCEGSIGTAAPPPDFRLINCFADEHRADSFVRLLSENHS